MPATVVDAVTTPYPCACRCHDRLGPDERAAGIAALYRFDDAMRGWGQTVIWDLAAPAMWRVQQQLGEVRWVAVRDTGCIHARLLGFCVHELIHAINGDPTQPNYGTPVGLPYGVPDSVAVADEAAYLHAFNEHEARAWVGLDAVAERLFGIAWNLLGARDVGTYGFPGGNAVVPVPAGFRPVPHYDSVHHPSEYYARARALEREARRALDGALMARIRASFEEAEAQGAARKKAPRPSPSDVALAVPRLPGRNDLCFCGSARKYKKCCGSAA